MLSGHATRRAIYPKGNALKGLACTSMMVDVYEIDEAQLARWKKSFAEDGIVYKTDEEYKEAINNLIGFFETLIEIDKQSKKHPEKYNRDERGRIFVYDRDGNKVIL